MFSGKIEHRPRWAIFNGRFLAVIYGAELGRQIIEVKDKKVINRVLIMFRNRIINIKIEEAKNKAK